MHHCQCQAHIYVLRKQIRLENADPRIHLLIHNKQKNPTWKRKWKKWNRSWLLFFAVCLPLFVASKMKPAKPKGPILVCLFVFMFVIDFHLWSISCCFCFQNSIRKPAKENLRSWFTNKHVCMHVSVYMDMRVCVCVRVHVHLCIQHTYVLMCLLTASRCIVHWTEHIHLYPSACSHIILTWNCFFAERIVRFPAFCTVKDPPAPLSSASELVQ